MNVNALPAYYEDSYQKELGTLVTAIGSDYVVLADTIFYPEGGGQPGDVGTLSTADITVSITDTKKPPEDSGDHPTLIRHYVSSTAELTVGMQVVIKLDWDRRHAHMKMHTALHVLGSLIPVQITGGSVGAEKSRLDFNLGELQIEKESLTQQLNELIRADHQLTFSYISEDELDANPDLVRTGSSDSGTAQPPRDSGWIRMVAIGNIDYQPCGGTHLNSLKEIGELQVKKIENKGKKNRRVHLVFAS